MNTAFVSFSSADQNFVNLLVALLDHHGVETWCSSTSLQAGDDFRASIKKALKTADALLVVATESSAGSQWVTKEIATFQAAKPDAPIVPLRMTEIDLRDGLDDLQDLKWIDFSDCMYSGFRELLTVFGREFLGGAAERRGGERRSRSDRRADDRRAGSDRRKSNVIQRMRKGFWKAFEEEVRIARFDEIDHNVRTRLQIYDALRPEADRYRFLANGGTPVDSAKALEDALDRVWEEVLRRGIHKAVYVIELIAEDLVRHYRVAERERRGAERRSNERRASERRA